MTRAQDQADRERAKAMGIPLPDEYPEERRGEAWEAPEQRNAQETTSAPGSANQRRKVTVANIATVDDLIQAGARVSWLWPGWVQIGVLTAVAAKGGTGKTRLCADMVRRIKHQLEWPDSQDMTVPTDALTLWVVADNHHDEMVSLAQDFGIKDSLRINAFKEDPYGGVSLDAMDDLLDLEDRINILKPVLVIVDTVGNATDRNLSKQEEAKGFYQPLQVIARKHRTAMLCLTHLNASGQFLGRRVLEKVRVAIRMEQPDPDQDKRRLEVVKTNAKRPPPLGMTMYDYGNDYDTSPPDSAEGPDTVPNRPPPPKVTEAVEWLKARLASGPQAVGRTRTAAELAGFSAGTLYRAKQVLGLVEVELQQRKWWKFPPGNQENT
jgi:AAA domain